MKKATLISLFALIVFNLTAQQPTVLKNSATVEQQKGVYIFMLSKPAAEYEYLGSLKKKVAWTGQPPEMLEGMLAKLKKDYPDANGIIFTSLYMEQADAIKFK